MERVVICPYCRRQSPEPSRPGLTHLCACGAVFATMTDEEMGQGMARMVSGLFQESPSSLTEMLDSCQVTVYRNFREDQAPPRALAEFIRTAKCNDITEPPEDVNLVWVARNDVTPPRGPFEFE